MQTILVIDNAAPHVATEALETLDCLLLVVNDLSRARHVLLNVPLDLWLCDLSIEELNFRSLHADSRTLNPNARILLTGPAISRPHAVTLINNGMADNFIQKPWGQDGLLLAVQKLLQKGRSEGAQRRSQSKRLVIQTGRSTRPLITARQPQIMVRQRSTVTTAAAVESDSRYRFDELIGEGGMGRIYRARDTLLDMEVAVKLLTHEFSQDADAVAGLKAETRLCLQLFHKHIVRVYNLEKRQDLFMIIMEYVKGPSLYQYLRQMPQGVPPDMVVQIVSLIGDALGYAHGKGVLHKDISPGNVIISDDGILKLIDFGVADHINRQKLASEYIMGTPVYMSPEQLRGEVLDVRSDVYSLGTLTYQLLTGKLPSSGEASFEELTSLPHPPLQDVAAATLEVLEIATSFDREARWKTIFDFVTALQRAWQYDEESGAWAELARLRETAIEHATDGEAAALEEDYVTEIEGEESFSDEH